MPTRRTVERAKQDKREGKSPSTQAGEFVREEIHHVRQGKHGARSAKQAIAIGLSKARRAGVKLAPPKQGSAPEKTRRGAQRDLAAGAQPHQASRKRSRATTQALRREGHGTASGTALAKQTESAAARRSSADRSAAAYKAVVTKGPALRSVAAKKAARTRPRHRP
jgi:hypothetical protein